MAQNNQDSKETNFKKNAPSDGIDEEYSVELADQDDIEAQARANAADQRAKRKK